MSNVNKAILNVNLTVSAPFVPNDLGDAEFFMSPTRAYDFIGDSMSKNVTLNVIREHLQDYALIVESRKVCVEGREDVLVVELAHICSHNELQGLLVELAGLLGQLAIPYMAQDGGTFGGLTGYTAEYPVMSVVCDDDEDSAPMFNLSNFLI